MNTPIFEIEQKWDSVFGEYIDSEWQTMKINPDTLLLSDVAFQSPEWEQTLYPDHLQKTGVTNKAFEITYNGRKYVQPVGATITLHHLKNLNPDEYHAIFHSSPKLKTYGGKRHSTKNRRRRSRSTRRNKRR
jgi:hypothetical protein